MSQSYSKVPASTQVAFCEATTSSNGAPRRLDKIRAQVGERLLRPVRDLHRVGSLASKRSRDRFGMSATGGARGQRREARPPIVERELDDVSVGATVARAGGQFLEKGNGVVIGAGSSLSVDAHGDGSVDVMAHRTCRRRRRSWPFVAARGRSWSLSLVRPKVMSRPPVTACARR